MWLAVLSKRQKRLKLVYSLDIFQWHFPLIEKKKKNGTFKSPEADKDIEALY